MNRLVRFFKTAGVFFLGNVITKLVSFLLLPLYTSKISPADYGTYSFAITIINVVTPCVFFCIWDSVFRFGFDCREAENKYKVLSTGAVVMLAGSVFMCAGFAVLCPVFRFKYPVLIMLYALSMGFQYYYTAVTRAFQNNNLFVFSGCVSSALSLIINVILIAVFDRGVDSLYISYIISVLFQIAIIERKIHIVRHLSFKDFRKDELKKYLRFSVPVTVSSISNWLLNGLTQVFITYKLGSYYNGYYNVANKFSSVLILGIGVFQFAWKEMAYDIAKDSNKNKYYRKSIDDVLKLSLAGVSVLILAVKLVYPFMISKEYQQSLSIIPILLFGTVAHSYASFVGTLLMADLKSGSLFTTTLAAGILNFILLNILVSPLGLMGAVLSLCISFIVFAAARLWAVKRKIGVAPSGSSYAPMVLYVIAAVAFYAIKSAGLTFLVMILIAAAALVFCKDIVLKMFGVFKNRKKAGSV